MRWAEHVTRMGDTRGRLRLKCDGTRAGTRFRLSAKQTSPFKSVGESVQSTTSSRGVCISGSNAGYTMFRSSVKSIGYPLHSPVPPSLSLPFVTVCHHISTGLYIQSFGREPSGKETTWKTLGLDWRDNIKMVLQEVRWSGVYWNDLAWDRDRCLRFCMR